MKAVVTEVRLTLREAVGHPWDRATYAATLGAMGLSVARIDYADNVGFLMALWGACAGVYALLSFAVSWAGDAPDEPSA